MKKFFMTCLVALFGLSLAACNNDTPTPNPDEDFGLEDDTQYVNIHYRRWDSNYSEINSLWLWPKDGEGTLYKMDKTDDFGVYAHIALTTFKGSDEWGLIVRANGSWTKDTWGSDRFFKVSELKPDSNNNYNIWLVTGDETMYTKLEDAFYDSVLNFKITYDPKNHVYCIGFKITSDATSYSVTKNGTEVFNATTDAASFQLKDDLEVRYILGAEMPDCADEYKVEVNFKNGHKSTEIANISALYDVEDFVTAYTYDGQLGAIYTQEQTTFRVWSPVSTAMKLRVYNSGTPKSLEKEGHPGDDNYEEYEMTRGVKGTWEKAVTGDLEGKYYTYVVTNYQYKNKEVVDPYAKSTGINGLRGMVVDFSKTNPTGWDSIDALEIAATNLTVYETHIADLTSSATWGGTAANAKKYKGFYEEGTTYTQGETTVSTGFDHVKELGVNAVQIIPIFDSDNNEVTPSFNWGYNPLNYNALDGSYSSNPYDGYEKIKEFKELVKAYHDAGMNIIMDVVYNHMMNATGSNFDVLMPGYYFRYNGNALSNGSGCGNETASNNSMFRKFMIDSTEFWATEYKLGGFRFDLMGIHDLETMAALADNLHTKIGSHITVYGEPWAGGTVAYASSKLANQANRAYFGEYGEFNDQLRDALIKGGMKGASELGFVTSIYKYDKKTVTADDFATYKAAGEFYKKSGDTYVAVGDSETFDSAAEYYVRGSQGLTENDSKAIRAGMAGFIALQVVYDEVTVAESEFATKVAEGLFVYNNTTKRYEAVKENATYDATAKYATSRFDSQYTYFEKAVTADNFESLRSELYVVSESKYVAVGSAAYDANAKYYEKRPNNVASQCVNYVTCHDNYTLVDRIAATKKFTDEAEIKKAAVLANSVVFTSEGITFMLAGEEFLRTKKGNSNSYNASYQVNELDYALKIKNSDVFAIYQKLIALKKDPKFLTGTFDESLAMLNAIEISSDFSVISYKYQTDTKEYYVIHKAGASLDNTKFNLEGYTLYLDTLGTLNTLANDTEVLPYQTIIAYKTI